MKRWLPWMLFGCGLVLLVCGFFYDALFAGIPAQDPTPEMTARHEEHSQAATWIMITGAFDCMAGLALYFFGPQRKGSV